MYGVEDTEGEVVGVTVAGIPNGEGSVTGLALLLAEGVVLNFSDLIRGEALEKSES